MELISQLVLQSEAVRLLGETFRFTVPPLNRKNGMHRVVLTLSSADRIAPQEIDATNVPHQNHGSSTLTKVIENKALEIRKTDLPHQSDGSKFRSQVPKGPFRQIGHSGALYRARYIPASEIDSRKAYIASPCASHPELNTDGFGRAWKYKSEGIANARQ